MIDIQQLSREFPEIQGLQEIGRGGQRVVLRGRLQNQDVALKVMLTAGANPRFEREVRLAQDRHFANVPELLDTGSRQIGTQHFSFIVEQFVPGGSLRSVLQPGQVMPVDFVIELLSDLLSLIASLEVEHLVHRDIKPENIIVGDGGTFWLLDFGIARDLAEVSITGSMDRFGPHTAGYAAPEQFRNRKTEIDSRADLFSVGVIAYECLTGAHPFASGARDHLDVLHRTETLQRRQIVIEGDGGPELAAFLLLLIDPYPSRRPRSAHKALDWFQEIKQARGATGL